jgi:CheY-like chemotaxis protein
MAEYICNTDYKGKCFLKPEINKAKEQLLLTGLQKKRSQKSYGPCLENSGTLVTFASIWTYNVCMTQLRILILEDDNAIRAHLSAVVMDCLSVKSSEAGTVKEACSLIEEEIFDLMLIDYQLPDGHGCEAVSHAIETKRIHEKSVVIFLSGISYVEMAPDIKAVLSKAPKAHVLNKPVRVEKLMELLKSELPHE